MKLSYSMSISLDIPNYFYCSMCCACFRFFQRFAPTACVVGLPGLLKDCFDSSFPVVPVLNSFYCSP